MNTDTGQIISDEEFQKLRSSEKDSYIPIDPTPKQAKARKVGRNEPCPCGSGKKFKRCHHTGGGYLDRKANRDVRYGEGKSAPAANEIQQADN